MLRPAHIVSRLARLGRVVLRISIAAAVAVVAGCHARLAPVPLVGPPASSIPGNRPPTVKVGADQVTVPPGGRVTLSADVYDPDEDHLSLKWSASSGSFNNPTGSRTYWTAPATAGPVTITFTADDGRGGVTTGTVTVTVAGS